jgi:hypothetical protein
MPAQADAKVILTPQAFAVQSFTKHYPATVIAQDHQIRQEMFDPGTVGNQKRLAHEGLRLGTLRCKGSLELHQGRHIHHSSASVHLSHCRQTFSFGMRADSE